MLPHTLFALLLCAVGARADANAQWNVYRPNNPIIMWPQPSISPTGAAASFTSAAAYNPSTLSAPPAPTPAIQTSVPVQLTTGGYTNLSIPQKGSFVGFSIEMSVAAQIIGKNSSILQVPFLNLMSNIAARAGSVNVRVGGNTQENAVLMDWIANGTIITKGVVSAAGTPDIQFTNDLIYMMANVSQLVNVWWYLGVPFYNTTPFDLTIVEQAQAILGDRLLAMQAGNEPDLYMSSGHRGQTYSPANYLAEFDSLLTQAAANPKITRQLDLWLAASTSTGLYNLNPWSIDQVWATGIVDKYLNQLHAMTVERYPNNNCAALFGQGQPINPQSIISSYLSHNTIMSFVSQYAGSAQLAVESNKPLIMFEANTASCGGFVGISDSYTASLWALDWSLALAANNFSGVNFHAGGQKAYYNPFTPPPTNQSTYRQWTVGPVYYAALAMAEVLGPSNQSRVVDLHLNNGADLTPGYAIYENGTPSKLALINYIDDPTGAQAYTVQISVGGGTTGQPSASPRMVYVKRLSAASVTQKNITWAGQTFGGPLESDGRLQGNVSIEQIACDTATNVCSVRVPAPGFALVFLSDNAFNEESTVTAKTYATTTLTGINTARVPTAVLATSNGHGGFGIFGRGDVTSPGSLRHHNAASRAAPALSVLVGVAAGAVLLGQGRRHRPLL